MSATQYSKLTAVGSHRVSNSHDVKKKKKYVNWCFGLMVVAYNVDKKA